MSVDGCLYPFINIEVIDMAKKKRLAGLLILLGWLLLACVTTIVPILDFALGLMMSGKSMDEVLVLMAPVMVTGTFVYTWVTDSMFVAGAVLLLGE